jgi:hypothetical protein
MAAPAVKGCACSCPESTESAEKTVWPVTDYTVEINIPTAGVQFGLRFNIAPTGDLIVQALRQLQDRVQPATGPFDMERHAKCVERFEDLIALVRLVPVLNLPTGDKSEHHEVKVAGVKIGDLSITAEEAWA